MSDGETQPGNPTASPTPDLLQRMVSLEANQKLLAFGLQQKDQTIQCLISLFEVFEQRVGKRLDEMAREIAPLKPDPGHYTLVEGYQLIVNDLADVKRVVIALQKRALATAADADVGPEITLPNRH